ncbi:general transcription factor II-I repeat domain-containing protein 2A [Trichonephila clavipes]|nr:general transcription factor II-I repeat domain-containing protein 2A [Trichonephila clavipes]
MFKYVSKNCHTIAASYSAANAFARHGKPSFQEGEFLKEVWLACAPSLFDDFDNKDKIIQRIKDVPLSRNTMKDRILKLAENVTDQQKNDINSAPFISLCLDESIDITKSARLAVFARYYVGNIIKEELIAITSLLTATRGTYICTAVRNSLAEKEIDLKKIVSVTTDGAPNMLNRVPLRKDFTEINSRREWGKLLGRIEGQNFRFRTAKTIIIKFDLHSSFVELESAKNAVNESCLEIYANLQSPKTPKSISSNGRPERIIQQTSKFQSQFFGIHFNFPSLDSDIPPARVCLRVPAWGSLDP